MSRYLNIFKNKKRFILGAFSVCIASATQAATINSTIVSAEGNSVGKVVFEDSQFGLLIKPQLSGLPAGIHGFHIHEHPNCGEKGMSAGGHLDPNITNSHQGPYGKGHLGDLPVLAVDSNGNANIPTLAPRLKTKDIKGHSIMIHAGGDNYSDNPSLGGGGTRIGCGTIPS